MQKSRYYSEPVVVVVVEGEVELAVMHNMAMMKYENSREAFVQFGVI